MGGSVTPKGSAAGILDHFVNKVQGQMRSFDKNNFVDSSFISVNCEAISTHSFTLIHPIQIPGKQIVHRHSFQC